MGKQSILQCDEAVHLPGKHPTKKEEDQRRANSHDVDKVDRWAAARGGSLVGRQASIKVVDAT